MTARILVIEDNSGNLELITYLLNGFGYQTLVARDGEGGLDLARREKLELILCDIQMPGIDGFEVARRLKAHPALRGIPLVAITSYAMVGDRDKILSAGFDGYISKPIAPETFISQVESFLRLLPTSADPESETPPIRTSKSGTGRKLLVVDSSPFNVRCVRSAFEPFGYQVIGANSVAEGIEYARQTSPPDTVRDQFSERGWHSLHQAS
jgi:two-component system cell cycle response regulator